MNRVALLMALCVAASCGSDSVHLGGERGERRDGPDGSADPDDNGDGRPNDGDGSGNGDSDGFTDEEFWDCDAPPWFCGEDGEWYACGREMKKAGVERASSERRCNSRD